MQQKYVERSLISNSTGENWSKWREIEKETMASIDEYAIPLEDGFINFIVRIQHHPDGEEGMGWTFIGPPQITKVEKVPDFWSRVHYGTPAKEKVVAPVRNPTARGSSLR